jgi:small subunit ribosomal protein S18
MDRNMLKTKRFKNDVTYFDYKDVKVLQRFVNMYGQIEQRGRTGLSAKQQRQLSTAIKRARLLALLPFVASN